MDSKGNQKARRITQIPRSALRQENPKEEAGEGRQVKEPEIKKTGRPRNYSVQIIEEKKMIPIHNFKMSGFKKP